MSAVHVCVRGTVRGLESDMRRVRLMDLAAETTFDKDEVTVQLENRYSGQGHRAALSRRRQQDDPWELIDARFGEERRLYIQQRGGNANNYLPSHKIPSHFHERGPGAAAATPRGFSGGHNLNDRGRPAPPRAPNHTRAPSPRASGTVRFGPGRYRVQRGEAGSRAVSNASAQSTAATSAAAAHRPTLRQPSKAPSKTQTSTAPPAASATSAPSMRVNPAAQAAAAMRASVVNRPPSQQPAPNTSSAQTSTATTKGAVAPPAESTPSTAQSSSIASAPSTTTSSVSIQQPRPAPSIARAPTTTIPTQEDPGAERARKVKYHERALKYAARPDEECDKYHERFPDCLRHLGPARYQLTKEATALAKNGNDRETSQYIDAHQERKWMVEAAVKAKSQVENNTEDEIEAFCTANPRHRDYIYAAKAVFTPKKAASLEGAEFKQVVPARFSETTKTDKQQHSESTNSSSDDGSVDTVISASIPGTDGTVAVTFLDITGELLGVHQSNIRAPVHAVMSITSRTRRFDPRELIRSIDAMAQRMVDRSQGLEGARLAEDGIWEEL